MNANQQSAFDIEANDVELDLRTSVAYIGGRAFPVRARSSHGTSPKTQKTALVFAGSSPSSGI
jgi:hypothetical protein